MYDGDLRRNLIVTTLFDPISKLIKDLEELVGQPGLKTTVEKTGVETTEQDPEHVKREAEENTEQEDSERIAQESEESHERTPPSPEYNSTNIERSTSTSTSQQVTQRSAGHVSCPICNESVLELHVNFHIDKCLNKANKVTTSEERESRVMAMPIFHLMKESEIRKRCKQEKLEITGDRKTLEARLKEFIVIWNSTCDDEDPLTRNAILNSIRKNEAIRNKNKVSQVFNFDAKTDQSVIDSTKEEYVKENKSQFDKLIAQAKLKRGRASSTVTNNNQLSEIQDGTTPKRKTPPMSETTKKTSEGQTPSKRKKFFFNFPSVNARLAAESAASTTSGSVASSPSVASTSTSKFSFKTPTKTASKVTCPVCNTLVLESIIQIHVERCLDKPESRHPNDTKVEGEEEDESEEQNTSYDLLCTTPEIIEGSSPDIVHSTPQRSQNELISTRSMRSKKGTK